MAIDIGANRGDFTQSLISRGFKVVAFEPNPIPFNIMKNQFRKESPIILHNVACGSKIDSLPLYIPCYKEYKIEGLASFHKGQVLDVLKKIRELKPFFFYDEKYVHCQSIKVKLVRLDDNKIKPDFIKIDTEGHESEVIKGSLATIQSSKPVIYLENPNEATLTLLIQLGYQISFQGKNNQILIPNSSLD